MPKVAIDKHQYAKIKSELVDITFEDSGPGGQHITGSHPKLGSVTLTKWTGNAGEADHHEITFERDLDGLIIPS